MIPITFQLLFISVFGFAIYSNRVHSETDYAVNLISKCDYKAEVHRNVQTEDGYLLTMHRIIGGPDKEQQTQQKPKTPVLLMHGLFGSSEHFLLLDCTKNFAYVLADEGYDVWIGNVRSVSYSRHHMWMNPGNKDYWNITFDEYGSYDLPALIDHILATTNQKQVMYIGHSQGNLIFYIMCSNRPEYANKVQLFVNLSPVATLNNLPHPWLPSVCRNINTVEFIVNTFNLYEWTLGRDFVREYGLSLCGGLFKGICKYVVYLFSGLPAKRLPDEDLFRLLTNCPEGISAKQFIQGCQMFNRKEFMKYDYGKEENMKVYGVENPPQYNLTKTTTPTAVYYCKNDWFLALPEVAKITAQLENVVDDYLIPEEDFSHFDFIIGDEAPKHLYSRIIKLMNTYREKDSKRVKKYARQIVYKPNA